MFLPISSTPQPERRQTPQRRHSIEKETPTDVRQFQPASRQSSKSLVSGTGLQLLQLLAGPPQRLTLRSACVLLQEEFCFPVECLSLTVEEVMHIRQVLVKAELEKFQQYKDVYNAMKKGKVVSVASQQQQQLNCFMWHLCSFFFFIFNCSFASVAEPKGFPCSPGPTSASSAKSKTSHCQPLKMQIILETVFTPLPVVPPFSPTGLCVPNAAKRCVSSCLLFPIFFQPG